DPTVYVRNSVDILERWDVISGLIKAAVFGFLLTLMGCYHGYRAQGGAQGVGRAATHAVVSAAMLIFAANFILTSLFV
ncbi:MAG: MlaE family ABC transporter permease, partial [Caulobacterales bacterium]|uniref:MlaE family ABC transporter permease n=1 Tax=Glycocaulis sp. TaxID=1969725 RepID=UPI003F9F8B07